MHGKQNYFFPGYIICKWPEGNSQKTRYVKPSIIYTYLLLKIGSDDDARQLHFWLVFSCFKVYIYFSQWEDEVKIDHDVWL